MGRPKGKSGVALLSTALVALASLGCSGVTTEHPIGELASTETSAGQSLVSLLDGAWIGNEDSLAANELSEQIMPFKYLGKGRIAIGHFTWDGQEIGLRQQVALLTENDAELYLHVDPRNPGDPTNPHDGSEARPEYWAMLLRPDQNVLRLYHMRMERIAAAVETNELEGNVTYEESGEGENVKKSLKWVKLTSTSDELAKSFTRNRVEELFDLSRSGELRRLAFVHYEGVTVAPVEAPTE